MHDNFNTKILIVDDEKDLCEILEFNLVSEGFLVEVAYSAEEALKKPLEEFDLLLLDVMMGNMSGFKLASKIRKELFISVPIIFLTAKTAENDILTGFNVGADDYILKPFSIKELVARIKAILKRGLSAVSSNHILAANGLKMDMAQKTVTVNDISINLTRKEFEILALLLKYEGQYIRREFILERIWDNDIIVTKKNVDVNIARLRKKIGIYGTYIKAKTGYGYRFKIL